jgi:hypothetical protein
MTTFSIMTLSVKGLCTTLSIHETRHKWHSECQHCRYAECHVLFFCMLSVIMINVVMLSLVLLSVIMLSAIMLSVVMLCAEIAECHYA